MAVDKEAISLSRIYTTDKVINIFNSEAKQTQRDIPKKDRRSVCVAGEIERWWVMPSRGEGMGYVPSGRVRWSCGVGLLELSSGWVVGDNRMPSLGEGKGKGYKAVRQVNSHGGSCKCT